MNINLLKSKNLLYIIVESTLVSSCISIISSKLVCLCVCRCICVCVSEQYVVCVVTAVSVCVWP